MEIENLRIGGRLKHARKVKKVSLKQLANQIGCSESLLSKVENGRTQPSLQTLHKLTQTLEISIGKLFAESESDKLRYFMKAKDRPSIALSQEGQEKPGIRLESIIPHSNPQLLMASIHIVQPGGSTGGRGLDGNDNVGTIVHEGEETGYILTGQLELTIDGKTVVLDEGDSFFFESHLRHGYRNPGNTETRVLWVCTPPTF